MTNNLQRGQRLFANWMSYRLLGGSAICAIGVTLGALQAAAQPANDNFAAATLIAGNAGTNSATTASATVEAGEPPHSGVRANSVWFVWTATNNTVVTFTAVAGNFDPVIAAYSGTNVTSLTRVAANDDAVVGLTSSRISFTAVKDVEYRIAVDRFSGTAGNFTLAWQVGDVPAVSAPVNAGVFQFSSANYFATEYESSQAFQYSYFQ